MAKSLSINMKNGDLNVKNHRLSTANNADKLKEDVKLAIAVQKGSNSMHPFTVGSDVPKLIGTPLNYDSYQQIKGYTLNALNQMNKNLMDTARKGNMEHWSPNQIIQTINAIDVKQDSEHSNFDNVNLSVRYTAKNGFEGMFNI